MIAKYGLERRASYWADLITADELDEAGNKLLMQAISLLKY